jgi:hypothetical protein
MEPKDRWKRLTEDKLMDERGSDKIDSKNPENNLHEDSIEFIDLHANFSRKADMRRLAAQEQAAQNAVDFSSLRERPDFPDCSKNLVVRTRLFVGTVIGIFEDGKKIELLDLDGKRRRKLSVEALLRP